MKTEEITIANLKCNGCASTIKKEILKLEGVTGVEVELEKDHIQVSAEDSTERSSIVAKLHALGYPEETEKNGLLLQLKSYSSCMVGRVNNMAASKSQ